MGGSVFWVFVFFLSQMGTKLSQHNVIIFCWAVFLFFEFWEFFVYYACRFSVRYMICQCFLPVYALSFHLLNMFSSERKFFILWNLIYQLCGLCFWCPMQELFAQPTHFLLSFPLDVKKSSIWQLDLRSFLS